MQQQPENFQESSQDIVSTQDNLLLAFMIHIFF